MRSTRASFCALVLCCAVPCHTIAYHTAPYHTIPCHTIPYHTIPYLTILYHAIPCDEAPYETIIRYLVHDTTSDVESQAVPVPAQIAYFELPFSPCNPTHSVSLSQGHPFYAPPSLALLAKMDPRWAAAYFKSQFRNPGAFRFVFVGAMDPATVVPLIHK